MNYRKAYMAIINHAIKENRKKLSKDAENYVYYERHHILPKSLFPAWKNRKSNLVLLTAREHFFCHQLLTKIYPGQEMVYAAFVFCIRPNADYKITSREYARLREEYSKKVGERNTGYKHWTNGEQNKFSVECPGEGFYLGTTYHKKDVFSCRKGREPWNKGKHNIYSEETKEKYSKTRKEIDSKLTKEERSKKYGSRKGKKAWNNGKTTGLHWYTNGKNNILCKNCPIGFYKGKILSKETKKKISETRLNKSLEEKENIKKKLSDSHKGYKMPQKQKDKIRKSLLKYHSENNNSQGE